MARNSHSVMLRVGRPAHPSPDTPRIAHNPAMTTARRDFLKRTALGLASAALVATARAAAQPQAPPTPPSPPTPPGMPPAFGTGPSVGPEVTAATFAEAEKLVQVQFTPAERAQAAGNWRVSMAPLYERRTGPRKVALDPGLAPASRWSPAIPGVTVGPSRDRFVRSAGAPRELPSKDEDIAFAGVRDLSRWIQSRALTSERLTRIYLDRLERFQPRINAVITLTRDLALAQARKADAEIAAGRYLGPLHGIPWGAKDLLDTAGIPTTYGAEPFRDRVPQKDAAVVER